MRGGGICSIDASQKIHHKFFKSISILISVFAFAVAGAACGGSDKKDKPSDADAGIIEDAGTDCPEGYWGENCDNNTITCEHGTPRLGREGDGKCSSCHPNTGWTGENCDVCEGNYWGANCNQAPTCDHGTPSLGLEGTGKCTECAEGYWGENCASNEIDCAHGTPSLGVEGNGKCASCDEGWDIEHNCAELVENYMLDKAGNVYKTTKIGDQTWMAKNMAWQDESVTCYANTEADPDFIKNYGCLYSWEDAKKVCPAGWKLPEQDEFEALLNYVHEHKTSSNELLALIARSEAWTSHSNEGTDEFGFSALPAGHYSNGNYSDFGIIADFWSATESGTTNVYTFLLHGRQHQYHVEINTTVGARTARSVRCLKVENKCAHGTPDAQTGHCQANTCETGFIGDDCDQCENQNMTGANCDKPKACVHGELDAATGHCQAGTCEAGFDGEDCDIAVVTINGQVWMTDNMAVTTGTDGSQLVCYGNKEELTWVDPDILARFGCLYTWDDAVKVCPAGWHVPTKAEFDALVTYADEHKTGSDLLLALIDPTPWPDYEGSEGDEFGFGALPAGEFSFGNGGEYYLAEYGTVFWAAKEGDNSLSYALNMTVDDGVYMTDTASQNNDNAYSVRCLKDAAVTE